MRFEKLNEDKIRITLSQKDLLEKDIDFHSFMSNSIESQDLFFDMLNEAEKEIGFSTKDYQIRIEALAMAGGDFILTVTRSLPNDEKSVPRKKVHIKRKKIDYSATQVIYSFNSFDDFCSFSKFINDNNISINNLAKNIVLYYYNNTYYLSFDRINPNYNNLKRFLSCITEFATFVNHSELFIRKLFESGKIIMKHNAIKTGINYFVKTSY